jgi:Fe-S cluster assembly protein SufD
MVERTDTERRLLERSEERPSSDRPDWWSELAQQGYERFKELGLPHRRVEAWKYTDLRTKLRGGAASALPSENALALDLSSLETLDVHMENGLVARLPEEAPTGLTILSLNQALTRMPDVLESYVGQNSALAQDSLTGLNSALVEDGVVILVNKDVSIDTPIVIHHELKAPNDDAIFTRNLVILDKGSQITLIESFDGASGPEMSHSVSEVVINEGAHLHHLKIQSEGPAATNVTTLAVELGEKAEFDSFTLSIGGAVARNEVAVRFAGEHSNANLNGCFILKDKQHCDTTTRVEHAVPNCTSNEVFRSVMADRSRGVFQGKISVEPDAQKTDARMMTRSLLLSDRAEMDAKPELEIYADDVKCAHGATIGSIDEEALFYLQSRGIDRKRAKTLLMSAFVSETLETVPSEPLKSVIRDLIEDRLAQVGEAAA